MVPNRATHHIYTLYSRLTTPMIFLSFFKQDSPARWFSFHEKKVDYYITFVKSYFKNVFQVKQLRLQQRLPQQHPKQNHQKLNQDKSGRESTVIHFPFTALLITDAFLIIGYVMGGLIVKIVTMNNQSSAIINVKIVNSLVQMEHAFRNLRGVMV